MVDSYEIFIYYFIFILTSFININHSHVEFNHPFRIIFNTIIKSKKKTVFYFAYYENFY